MKSALVATLFAVGLAGCAAQSTPPQSVAGGQSTPATRPLPADPVVASIEGDQITLKQLTDPLIEAYGLNMLLELSQLDLAEQAARVQGITISNADVDDEITQTLIAFRKASNQGPLAGAEPATEPSDQTLTPEERQRQLGLLLSSQRLTPVEFNLVMRCEAVVRKLVTPGAVAQLTEQNVRDHFNAIYGEKARVRFIRLPDMLTVAKVEGELKSGRTFDEESRLHAYDSQGRPSSQELPPFSRQDLHYPAEFKMVAFGLKPGTISDPVQIQDSIYLVQLMELIPPQHANFDDYKDSVRKDLLDQEVQGRREVYLQNLRVVLHNTIEIKDPVLRKQWELNLRNADELREQLRKQQNAASTQPSPTSAPAGAPPAKAPAQ